MTSDSNSFFKYEKKETQAFGFKYDLYTTQELIDEASKLPIHKFHQEIPPGKVLEIGYKMGALVLYYASHGRQVHALDQEPHYEEKLRERLEKETYRDLVSFSLSSLPSGKLPNEQFALIIIGNVLHFFDFGTAQLIVDRLSKILMPGGLIFTVNHHKSHLYTNNPKLVGPDREYKHFFSEEEIARLFPKQMFTEKFVTVKNHCPNEKERMVTEYYWNLFPHISREKLKGDFIDIEYHTDIFTVHQKKPH